MSEKNSKSLYGKDMLPYIEGFDQYAEDAYQLSRYALTHGGIFPEDQALQSLPSFDLHALELLKSAGPFPVCKSFEEISEADITLQIYINNLGRLHVRPCGESRPIYEEQDSHIDLGYVKLSREQMLLVSEKAKVDNEVENVHLEKLKFALDKLHDERKLEQVLKQVTDHVEHVESVCFYASDEFFTVIDRHTNLVDTKSKRGYLNQLNEKRYSEWTNTDILIVAALHALFISGRAVRFEEFNGMLLTATKLFEKFDYLLDIYRSAGCEFEVSEEDDVFDLGQIVRDQTLKAVGQDWLRYRWIYALNFNKTERLVNHPVVQEPVNTHINEFSKDYELITGSKFSGNMEEHAFFEKLADEALKKDLKNHGCKIGSVATTTWVEYLIERIVESSVLATDSDYGMSSSIRDMSRLVKSDHADIVAEMHKLTPPDFYTSFVSNNFSRTLSPKEASVIASSVQQRMIFNRWHFIPGNFERELVSNSRHWYYPPLIPDLAIHSDVHREAHARARVKYSIRAPGPDMSQPPLVIAGQNYRGFYDIRVVRMTGRPYTIDDMLIARRRTLWMANVFKVLVQYLEGKANRSFAIRGFQPGTFLDTQTIELAESDVA